MKLAIVIQARTASTRLPGKVLLPVAGKPLLERMLERVTAARHARHVLVATTTNAADDAIVALCAHLGVPCFRGHPDDCLDRHYQAGLWVGADAVVKIPSDCPLIDPRVIDRVLSVWSGAAQRYDYLGNLRPATWPDGNDVEVMSMAALDIAAREATDTFDREHTSPFLWSRPERFRLGNVVWETGYDYSRSQRWVVDWHEDYLFVCEVFSRLLGTDGTTDACFSVNDILALLGREPQLAAVNAEHQGYNYMGSRALRASFEGASQPRLKETTP